MFVKDLKPGDLVEQSDGKTLKVGTIEIQQRQTTVYNMTVEGFHTYFVSGLGIWVHNDSCIPWSSKGVQSVANQLDKGAREVTFGSKSQAEKYF
ncbi:MULTISPECIES: polymorphic toxin-type HINT domain-containing protein [Saccharibacillus]|uniref:polymorphic toxin-type HINT domain-containing protein n=1 Tax=Saccharibacillus TaxID=456492 RepID=UPI001310C90E|nr:hypothetical protein [Saccharibacillus sp. WB 17]